jgi:hypothetical protein
VPLGDDLQIGGGRGVGLAAALVPILQGCERDAVGLGEFVLPTFAVPGGWHAPRALRRFETRTARGLPSAWSQASVRLSISSLQNLFIALYSAAIGSNEMRSRIPVAAARRSSVRVDGVTRPL